MMRFFSMPAILIFMLFSQLAYADDPSAPPGLDEETKGTPAFIQDKEKSDNNAGLFGDVKITESRHKNGLAYRIEMKHPLGAKQVMEETDSDGKIESKNNDIEETPNLPKWKIGSW